LDEPSLTARDINLFLAHSRETTVLDDPDELVKILTPALENYVKHSKKVNSYYPNNIFTIFSKFFYSLNQ